MLGPNFLEGQAPRSAEQPKEITLEDGYSLEMLLALMHHFDLDTLRSLDGDLHADTPLLVSCIASAFDKYCCAQALGLSVKASLRRSAKDAIIDDDSIEGRFNTYAQSAACACLIGSKDLFTEATRCMVLDGLKPFSDLANVLFCRRIPVSVLLGLEEQRTAARNAFISSFSGMTDRGCFNTGCSASSVSTKFSQEMKRILTDWPPLWTTASLRSVLRDMDGSGNVSLGEEGDCNHSKHTEIDRDTVKRVLAFASPVLKQMLGPHFLEGQAPRSAEHPVVIQLPEDGAWEMPELLLWMHHGELDSRYRFWDPLYVTCMAVHIDKYACGAGIRLIAEALLKRQLEKFDSTQTDPNIFDILAWTAKAAYLLGASDLFTRCTRRLILVGSAPYSNIPNLTSGVNISNKEILSVTVLLGMEEQRSKARNSLLHELDLISEGCVFPGCKIPASSSTFPQEMARKQTGKRWPPSWEATSLRCALQDLEGGGEVIFQQKVDCSHTPCQRVSRDALSAILKLVEEEIHGMCFACARQDKMQSTCEHTEQLKKKTAHPIFV
ncbi:hypothetical protein LTR17_024597 [Elasticomyces elasticus]|nr:hypothetical protein LTR17_024597 [Elasticomyces elasticus]